MLAGSTRIFGVDVPPDMESEAIDAVAEYEKTGSTQRLHEMSQKVRQREREREALYAQWKRDDARLAELERVSMTEAQIRAVSEQIEALEKGLPVQPGTYTRATNVQPAGTPPASPRFATEDPGQGRGGVNAAKCPVHQTRMAYDPAEPSWYCTSTGADGKPCTFKAYPKARSTEMLRNTKYTGTVQVLAVPTTGESGQPGTEIYLMLNELGVVVNVTEYVDITKGEPIHVNNDGSVEVAMLFPKIQYAKGN